MFIEEPLNEKSKLPVIGPRSQAAFSFPLILIVIVALLAGGVGGAAVTLFGQSYLRPFLGNSLNLPAVPSPSTVDRKSVV